MLHGGIKYCPEGCLGLGSCVRACPFDAIEMGPDNMPVVLPDMCRACGKCVEACPRGVMSVFGLSERLLHLNRVSDCLAPCRQRCPAQINIPKYIERVREGDPAGAVLTIKERNPLLLVCGRVCPHPCEEVCRRGHVDEPIAINSIKRFAADWEMHSGTRLDLPTLPDTGRKVAVIGGGPAGLSCAYFLRRLGHHPVLFEAMPELGGQLRYGIPEYRLPKKVLDWEIQGILDLGVDVQTEKRFGRDFTLEELRTQGFEAFFLGIGAWQSSDLRAEGYELEGVMAGTEFLTSVGLGVKTGLGKDVVVVGGGNTAIDAARTSVRMGADSVTIMYRRTEKEMPANDLEIEAAKEEGVKFAFLSNPVRVIPDENGHALELEYVRMELGEPDASGRRRPVAMEGSETRMKADTVIAAIGQAPDLSCLYDGESKTCPLDVTERWRIVASDPNTLQTSIPDCFAGGDAYHGPALVITAVGDGRRAARSIHHLLASGEIPLPPDVQHKEIPYTLFDTVTDVEKRPRPELPETGAEERIKSFVEVEQVIDPETARKEACRCLNCGLTCYDRTAWPGEETPAHPERAFGEAPGQPPEHTG